MSDAALAILRQIKALPAEERQELLAALPSTAPVGTPSSSRELEKIYDALDWRYVGGLDDAARVDELQR